MADALLKNILSVAAASFVGLTAGCGTTTTTSPELNVEMVAVFSPPPTATGNVTPISQEYKLEAVNFTDAAGTVTNMVTEAQSYKIVNRPQIILTAPLSDYKGTSFVKVAVQFSAAIKTSTKTNQDLASSLTTTSQELVYGFLIEETSSVRIIIKAKWGNSVTLDADTGVETVADPVFELKVE